MLFIIGKAYSILASIASFRYTIAMILNTAQKDVLLVTLNASYHHSAFGLRYLFANLQEFQPQSKVLEFTINQKAKDIVEKVLEYNPKIIGFGVYIWNTKETFSVISILKKIRPELTIILGGPEVSYESEQQAICKVADYVVSGEADFLFYELVKNYFQFNKLPREKFLKAELPDISKIQLPYGYYSEEDIVNRVIYVEASRGCPYKCEYCLSSLDQSVRNFPIDHFLLELDKLVERGVRQFKFVDRTFNLNPTISTKILQFFLDRVDKKIFLHFEMVPDRLPEALKELIQKFPQGSLQFEIGIQTWNPKVASLVSRRQDYGRVINNLQFLREKTTVHTHVDLIVGLPGENKESFAQGFDAVLDLNPDEIQVGILKLLKGTPISRHNQKWEMLYQEEAPFQVLQTKLISYQEMRSLERFAKFWDLYSNSGNFLHTMNFLRKWTQEREKSFFQFFFDFTLFLSNRHAENFGISLLNLLESLWLYLTQSLKIDTNTARKLLIEDYSGRKKRDIPYFLRENNMVNFEQVGKHGITVQGEKGLKRQSLRLTH